MNILKEIIYYLYDFDNSSENLECIKIYRKTSCKRYNTERGDVDGCPSTEAYTADATK